MSLRRVRIRVHGVVQGVGFRAATRATARGLGLAGWVRNEQDGDVVAEAQGPAAQVDALIAWCRRGPPLADVERVDVEELEAHAVDTAEREFGVAYR